MLDSFPFDTFSWVALRTAARLGLAGRVRLRVQGRGHVPRRGPVLLASRHYHHLLDALVLLSALPRQTHFLVALDWVQGCSGRRLMEGACRAARWPVILRAEELRRQALARPGRPVYGEAEVGPYLRRGIAEGTALLRAGRALVLFPEAYPNVDPDYTPKGEGEMLPFRSGFARLAILAAKGGAKARGGSRPAGGGGTPVPVVPAGLQYRLLEGRKRWLGARWEVTLRFGPPVPVPDSGREALDATVRQVQRAVCRLSGLPGLPGVAGEDGGQTDETGSAPAAEAA
jgi:1-acyl-sn-glycerol-3-phosphate acyltransferase